MVCFFQHPVCLRSSPAVGPKKKKSKAQKEAERLQAEEEERKAEILRAKREAERIRKEAEDAKRLKEEQVRAIGQTMHQLRPLYANRCIYQFGFSSQFHGLFFRWVLHVVVLRVVFLVKEWFCDIPSESCGRANCGILEVRILDPLNSGFDN